MVSYKKFVFYLMIVIENFYFVYNNRMIKKYILMCSNYLNKNSRIQRFADMIKKNPKHNLKDKKNLRIIELTWNQILFQYI